jgi:hypothetical protein
MGEGQQLTDGPRLTTRVVHLTMPSAPAKVCAIDGVSGLLERRLATARIRLRNVLSAG